MRADYALPTEFIDSRWPNSVFAGLTVSQRFLFSRTAHVPPHEPGSVLNAARCHPLTVYRFTPKPDGAIDPSKDRYRISSIRFDYRIALTLDSRYDAPDPQGTTRLPNNAGLFRDTENAVVSPAGPLTVLGKLGIVPISAWAASQVAFAAVEKPLLLEVATRGLYEGAPLIGPRSSGNAADAAKAPRCWDNVHWWGARGAGQPMISAPGAFHAAHVHWRWGGAGSIVGRAFGRPAVIPEIDIPAVPAGAEGYWWQREGMRLLVDPAIWIQSIRVAVTRVDTLPDPRDPGVLLEQLSRQDWSSMFTDTGPPRSIEAGGDIVLWYSAEVHSQTRFPAENYYYSNEKSQSPARKELPLGRRRHGVTARAVLRP